MDRILTGVALFSGGLDSILAIRLILDQGCKVEALSFNTPFFEEKTQEGIEFFKRDADCSFTTVDITQKFLDILVAPRYGYGKHLNPCIDCKILMLKEAKAFMERKGADFIFTGEVLGQRPMSQRRDTLRVVEKGAGLEGILLRPLSARLLSPTYMEEEGYIDRERLLDLSGRSRKRQMALARELHCQDYPAPGGGCLLTDKGFANRLRPLMAGGNINRGVIKWLRIGRHFSLPQGQRLIVGRNRIENESIQDMAEDNLLLSTIGVPGPVAVVLSDIAEDTKRLAASIVAGYSDASREEMVEIEVLKGKGFQEIIRVFPMPRVDIQLYRI